MNRKETRSFMIKKPLMALRDVVALPGVTAYIEVAKAETVSAMEAAMNDDQMVFTVAKKDAENSDVNMDNLFEVGTVAKVKQIARMPDKYVRVVLEGGKRAHLLALETVDAGYIMATVQVDEDEEDVWDNVQNALITERISTPGSLTCPRISRTRPSGLRCSSPKSVISTTTL